MHDDMGHWLVDLHFALFCTRFQFVAERQQTLLQTANAYSLGLYR